MRVIAGSLKRRSIRTPTKADIRPSSDRTREALFNRLQFRYDWPRTLVLDLFAGSGSVGLEAISRGAEEVVFVESDPRVFEVLTDNVERMGVEDRASLVCADVFRYMSRHAHRRFDLIFADPPYAHDRIGELPDAMVHLLAPEGLAILEHDRHSAFDEHASFADSRSYGRTVLTYFDGPAEDGDQPPTDD